MFINLFTITKTKKIQIGMIIKCRFTFIPMIKDRMYHAPQLLPKHIYVILRRIKMTLTGLS